MINIAPDFLDIAFTTRCVLPVDLHARRFFKRLHHFEGTDSLACSDVEVFDGRGVFTELFDGRGVFTEHACHRLDVCLGKVNDINIVADAGAVGCAIVVAEDFELLSDSDGGLCDKGDEVHWHSIGQFAALCT